MLLLFSQWASKQKHRDSRRSHIKKIPDRANACVSLPEEQAFTRPGTGANHPRGGPCRSGGSVSGPRQCRASSWATAISATLPHGRLAKIAIELRRGEATAAKPAGHLMNPTGSRRRWPVRCSARGEAVDSRQRSGVSNAPIESWRRATVAVGSACGWQGMRSRLDPSAHPSLN
jgi:hypothetical protein